MSISASPNPNIVDNRPDSSGPSIVPVVRNLVPGTPLGTDGIAPSAAACGVVPIAGSIG